MPSNKQSMIDNRFDGDEEKYKEHMRKIGVKGGNSELNGLHSPIKGNSQKASELAKKRWAKVKGKEQQ